MSGYELEYRLSRLFFSQGYFSRRGVPLISYFYPEQADITDLDAYGIKWNPDFTHDSIIAMCSTAESKAKRKSANRTLLLSGLVDLLDASRGYLAMPTISDKFKAFATANRIIPIDFERLEELEKQLGLSEYIGSNSPQIRSMLLDYWKNIKKAGQADTKSFYWFLVSGFWRTDSNVQIKRIKRYSDDLISRSNCETDFERWILVESAILLAVALLKFCHDVTCVSSNLRRDFVRTKMIEGISTIEEQEQINRSIYAFVSAKVEEVCGRKIEFDRNEIRIKPPEYTPLLMELIERLIKNAQLSIEIPRFMDCLLYETIISKREIAHEAIGNHLDLDEKSLEIVAKLAKNIVKFLDPDSKMTDLFDPFLSF